MKYLKLFEDFDSQEDPYSLDELISLNPKQLGELLLRRDVIEQPTLVKRILDFGARVDVQDSHMYGYSPLHVAAMFGKAKVFNMLIKAGANVDARDNYEATPLHYAAYAGDVEGVKVLIDAGASIHVYDIHDQTPWDVARSTYQDEMTGLNPYS